MNKRELKKRLAELDNRRQFNDIANNFYRAHGISVGTCFGGTTEIMMRGDGDARMWCIMQPVEVIELIHQLAANVGCHIHIKPRKDFSSWREWNVTEEEKEHLNGFPPFVNDMAPHKDVGQKLPPPQQQPGLQPSLMAKDEQNETVAIKKPQNRRSTKRTAKAA